ncbi:hypothetical protein [Microbispora rosea]|uniref:hypothetical protein n=1 Tax=Microbispora rosea TaxID=58117 RepID=UPI0037AE789C
MTATLDQPGLFDLEQPKPRPKRARRLTHTPRPRRSKEAQAEECDPTCLVCGKAEGKGLCSPKCAVVCSHTRQPDLVEVCLVTTRVTAVLVEGARTLTGSRPLALVLCPHCGDVHWHAPAYGVHYRLSGCGQPYVVHLPRPRFTPGGTL